MDSGESLWQAGTRRGGVSSSTFYGRFRRYLRAAGLAPTGLHVLRHSAAKLRREAGESVEAVSALLDHSSLAVTTVYLRRLEGDEDRTWAQVAGGDRGGLVSARSAKVAWSTQPEDWCIQVPREDAWLTGQRVNRRASSQLPSRHFREACRT